METQEQQLWITDDHQSIWYFAPPMNICRTDNGQEVRFCVFLILLPWQLKAARDTNHNGTKKFNYVKRDPVSSSNCGNKHHCILFFLPSYGGFICMYVYVFPPGEW